MTALSRFIHRIFGCSPREKRAKEQHLDRLSHEVEDQAKTLKARVDSYQDAADPLVALMVDLHNKRAWEDRNGDDHQV